MFFLKKDNLGSWSRLAIILALSILLTACEQSNLAQNACIISQEFNAESSYKIISDKDRFAGGYFKEANCIYYSNERIKGIDFTTILTLSHYPYFKDQNFIYASIGNARGDIFLFILDADEKTFSVLDRGYAKDDKNVFFYHKKIQGATPQTFEVLYSGYSEEDGTDYGYARDQNNVYFNSGILQGATPQTFELLGSGYSKDNNYVYFDSGFPVYPNKIEADANSFKYLGAGYARDKNNFYKEGKIVKHQDIPEAILDKAR